MRTLPQLSGKRLGRPRAGPSASAGAAALAAALAPALAALLAAALGATCAPAARAASDEEALRGPDVTIIAQEDKTVFEFRQAGQLRMVRIVPRWGKPYYLVPRDPTKGYGDLERADMLLPSWVIAEF